MYLIYARTHKLTQINTNYTYTHIGIALVLEGFMSGFYHICPSGSNFQFGKCNIEHTFN